MDDAKFLALLAFDIGIGESCASEAFLARGLWLKKVIEDENPSSPPLVDRRSESEVFEKIPVML